MPLIELSTPVNAPTWRCFDLSRNTELHQTSPTGTNEKAAVSVLFQPAGPGQQVTWRVKHFGMYQPITVTISEFEFSKRSVTEMIKGAFRRMRHEHIFETAVSGTVMKDHFFFEFPFGIPGIIVNRLVLSRHMEKFLKRRDAVIRRTAGTDGWKKLLPRNKL